LWIDACGINRALGKASRQIEEEGVSSSIERGGVADIRC
jgi:hypothetical protein